jgi:hypothetical protein
VAIHVRKPRHAGRKNDQWSTVNFQWLFRAGARNRFGLAAKMLKTTQNGTDAQAWIATGAGSALAMTIDRISSAAAAVSTLPGMTEPLWLLDPRQCLLVRVT